MKGIIIPVLFLSLTLGAFAQADSNTSAKPVGFSSKKQARNVMLNGLKQGYWVEYYMKKREGMVETKDTNAPYYKLTIYESGRPADTVKEYYKGGHKYLFTPYKDGKKNGKELLYYEDGKVNVETIYKYGEKVSTKKYDQDGNEVK